MFGKFKKETFNKDYNELDFKNIDTKLYKKNYKELKSFSDEKLIKHYKEHGFIEGKIASQFSERGFATSFLNKFPGKKIEIGPFISPVLIDCEVDYFDVLDKQELERRADQIGYKETRVPDIKFVSENGDLSIVDKDSYDLCVSSHCIEHQPNLIAHINNVGDILRDGGYYFLFIPNCRYCFDHFIGPSNVAQIIQAHLENRTTHTISSVIEHRALTTHNNPKEHWKKNHGERYSPNNSERIKLAIQEYEAAAGAYIDVHAWQFTPVTFKNVINALCQTELINMKVSSVFNTVYGSNEFMAVLSKK